MTGLLQKKRKWLAANWIPLIAILVLGLIPFASFIGSGEALFASDQLGAPGWKYHFESLLRGEPTLWTPYGLGGMPTFDAGFGDGAYPLFLLVGLLFPITTFIGYAFVLHTLIAGVNAYLLVNRFFGLNRLLSLALACAYMLNTNFISHVHAGHTGKFYIMAWLPLALYLLLRGLGSKARWYHALGLALVMALMMTANHPQLTYFTLMGFFLIWVWKTVDLVRAKRMSDAAWTAGRFWGPILLGIGLAFFLFYPPTQWTKNYGVRGSGEKMTYEHATSWSMHPEETASLIVPEFGGINDLYWGRNPFKLNSEYPGISVWFLAILGLCLFRKEKGRWYWLWGGVGLLAIIYGLGAHTPLFHLFYSFIPGIKNFRAPSMMLFWLATALLVMSADTLSRLCGNIPEAKRRAWGKRTLQIGLGVAGALLFAGLAPGAAYGIWNAVFGGEPWRNLAAQGAADKAFAAGAFRTAVLLAALVYAAWRWLLKDSEPLKFGSVLLVVTLVDLYWVDSRFIKTYPADRFLAQEAAVDFLKADTSRFRVFGMPGTYERWQMQFNEIETTDGWTDNEYRLYREYRGGDYQQNPNFMHGLKQNPDGSVSGSPFLDLLNVKYLAYRQQGGGPMGIAENKTVLPRAWFASSWETVPDSLAMAAMKQPGFDARTHVIVSDSTPLPSGFTPPTPAAASVIEKEWTFNRMAYQVENPARGLLVLSELYFPNWKVKLNGKDAPMLKVDYAFRGVALEPGSHSVVLEYHSPWMRKGFMISGLSALLLILGVAGLRYAERKGMRNGN